jgi:predicted ATPase/DNA-binding winged helix-turn-helix (wHTH) protein
MSFGGVPELAFGSFRVSVRDRTLTDRTGKVALPSRAFDVLVALIESRAAVLSKEDLRRQVWGDVIVEDNNLHVQIAAVRRALGPESRYIQTVPGRGYRFIADLSRETPTPSTLAAPAGNLPVPMTRTIGREVEMATICDLLLAARLVTLVGPAGVGKTRLALAAAEHAGPFADGPWLLDLSEATDLAAPAASLVAALGSATGGEQPGNDLAATLAGRETLLLLDGCEPLIEAAAAQARRLVQLCPQLRILATSQQPLGLEGEHVVRIAPFELPREGPVLTLEAALRFDAVRLFADRAAMVDGRFRLTDESVGAALQICRALDGVPLAIELAASRAPVLGLEPLLARIQDRLTLLAGDRRDLPARHRTLRAAIGWSHRLASDLERQVLRRLAIFPGEFTLAAAQVVAAGDGVAPHDVVRGVGGLVQRSLVATGADLIRPRHRLLQVVRDFVRQQPGYDDDHPELARRHADYFVRLAEAVELSRERGDAATVLGPELDNLREALAWTLSARGDAAVGLRLAVAMTRIWFEASLFAEAAGWLARALDAAPPSTDRVLLMRLHRLADLSASAVETPSSPARNGDAPRLASRPTPH